MLKIYNNLILMWLLFKQRFHASKKGTSFRLNVYYGRMIVSAYLKKDMQYRFFDFLISGYLPVLRKNFLKFFFVNESIVVNISD